MRIDKDMVDNMKSLIEEQKEIWSGFFPRLQFDEWGRAKLMNLTGIQEEDCRDMRYPSNTFVNAFNEYLKQKGYEIRTRYSNFDRRFYASGIDLYDYVENYYHFRKNDGKLVRVKASKVLAHVQNIWEKSNPEFIRVRESMKALREQGATYDSSEGLRELMNLKTEIERGNLNVIYQSIMNQHNGTGTGVYLSINPLDLLTSSGDRSGNPTSFGSCWSTYIYEHDDYINVSEGSCFADPDAIITLGEIENRCILYIPNGREVSIPNTSLSLLGYRERVHGWFDTEYPGSAKGIWLEKVYPAGTDSAKMKYTEALEEKGVKTITIDFDNRGDFRTFSYQDSVGLGNFNNTNMRLFLDRVGISYEYNELHYLPENRTNYDYGDDTTGILEGSTRCEDCGCHCDEANYISNHGYVCEDCVSNYDFCSHCEEHHHIDNMRTVTDNYGDEIKVCESCRDEHYYYCKDCDSYVHYDLTTTVKGDYMVCDDCLSDNYTYCTHCDEYVLDEDMASERNEHGEYICQECLDDDFIYCESCGKYCEASNSQNLDEGTICENCIEEHYECSECNCIISRDSNDDGDGTNYCDDCVPVESAI